MENGSEDKPWQIQSGRSRGSSRSKARREELAQFKRQEGDAAGQGVVNRKGVQRKTGSESKPRGMGCMQSEMERPGEFSEGEGRQRVCDEDGLPEQGEQDRLTGACSIPKVGWGNMI